MAISPREPLTASSCSCSSQGPKQQEDEASNKRLIEALFGGVKELQQAMERDPAVASHLQLDTDAEGSPSLDPLQQLFAYVDEQECCGCTWCAAVARNTFVMEPDAGKARAFAQEDDDPAVVLEAIDCCPSNCISFVDYQHLVLLEQERDGVGTSVDEDVHSHVIDTKVPTEGTLEVMGDLNLPSSCLDVGTQPAVVSALFANPYSDGDDDKPPPGFGDGCTEDGGLCI